MTGKPEKEKHSKQRDQHRQRWEHKTQTLSIRGQAPELKRLGLCSEGIWERGGSSGAFASAWGLWLLEAGEPEEAAAGILVVWKRAKSRQILEGESQETGS